MTATKHSQDFGFDCDPHQFNLNPWGRKNDNSGNYVVGIFQHLGLVQWTHVQESAGARGVTSLGIMKPLK